MIYTKKELQAALRQAVPSVQFMGRDSMGTAPPKYRVECRMPTDDLPAFEAACHAIGRKAIGIGVVCYGNFSFRVVNLAE